MAVARLADELLQMILAPSLTISHQQFVSDSLTTFGENDMVSSASVLLVCKRWLRVATPMLYETVIVRSTGQSHALADAFRYNPAFAKYVRRLRLEGSFASLDGVLSPCKNLVTFVLLLHIYSDANVAGLCRSLSKIDPVEVVLHDPCRKDNTKVRKVLLALCDAIPKWTKMASFDYPYGQYDGRVPLETGSSVSRRGRLMDALAQSKSLQVFCSPMDQLQGDQWRRLARVSSVAFKFYYYPRRHLDLENLMTLARKQPGSTSLTTNSIEFIDLSKTSTTHKELGVSNTNFPEPSFGTDAIGDDIWSTILAFAALPGYPNPPELYGAPFHTETPKLINTTRKAISLTCRKFERIIRPLLFTVPVMPTLSSFNKFADIIVKYPHLGHGVRVLAFSAGSRFGEVFIGPTVEARLLALLPHLTCLLHFDSGLGPARRLGMTTEILSCLTKVAGDTLLTLRGFDCLLSQPLSLAQLTPFKNLRMLDIPYAGISQTPSSPGLNPFPHLRNLRIHGSGQLFHTLCTVSIWTLKSVTFIGPRVPAATMAKFLMVSGSKIEELSLIGFDHFGDILSLAPSLRHVDVDVQWQQWQILGDGGSFPSGVDTAPDTPPGHEKLETLTLHRILDQKTGEKDQKRVVEAIFGILDFAKFPSLKEICLPEYEWPVEERAISRQLLPKKAVQVKEAYGIEIKDKSGKPWRSRAQRRR